MKRETKSTASATAAELRRRAEASLRTRLGKPRSGPGGERSQAGGPKSAADTQRLLHELQVHQVELELQNTELQSVRDRIEALLEKYTDLYDFAPVGYFSLDEDGLILEVNLAGAALLGVERSQLVQRCLKLFVAPPSRPTYQTFLVKTFEGSARRACELSLQKPGGAPFWVDLQAVPAVSLNARRWCRVAISDITARKKSREVERRAEALAAANQELNREITRRQTLEDTLKRSEQHQSQLLVQAHQMQAQLRHLSHQILQAQEEERKRISRELHDEIAQTLVGINVHLENLARAAAVPPRQLKREIVRTQRLVEKSVNLVHQFARELRPTALDDLGLIAALESFLKDFMKRTGIRVDLITFAEVKHLSSARRTVLYRIVHSALTNVAQHAHASRVKVNIRRLGDAVQLEITDNGRSFEVNRVLDARKPGKHLGLLGMRERVEMVGGAFHVESAPGRGTTIRAQIPFERKPAGEGGGAGGRDRGGKLKPGFDGL